MNQQPDLPKKRFTGIFIPVELLEFKDLSFLDLILVSWVDALFDENHGGCFASNDYLANKLGEKPNSIAKALGRLRKIGLIEDVSFDGRRRVIRALIHKFVDAKHQDKKDASGKAALEKNPIAIGKKSNPDLEKNPSTPIYESKEESKDKKPHIPLKGEIPVSGTPPVGPLKYGKFVSLTKEEFEEARNLCGGTSELSDMIEAINDHLSSTGKKPYKDYLATIRNWLRRRKQQPPIGSYQQKPKENKSNADPVSKDQPRRANEHVF